jgi:hypothetical protein
MTPQIRIIANRGELVALKCKCPEVAFICSRDQLFDLKDMPLRLEVVFGETGKPTPLRCRKCMTPELEGVGRRVPRRFRHRLVLLATAYILIRMSELQVTPATLLFFIDDTGHELLNDPVQKVFGLGGCSIMGGALDTIVRRPWCEVRRTVLGTLDAPLHAADIKNPTSEQIDAVTGFFRNQTVGRFGAICSVETKLDSDLTPLRIVAELLKRRITEIAKWQHFDSITLIFEHSERLAAKIEEIFSSFELALDGRAVPLELCWMQKSEHEPALEVADFLANAIGAEVRHRLAGKPGFAKNFQAFFHCVDRRLVSFVDAREAKLSGT